MIKNLQKQLNPGGFIKIGKKGKMITSKNGKEFRPPQKLTHFQLVTTEKDKNDNYIIDVDLQNKIKKSGNCVLDGEERLIGIPIRLLYNDTELNFPNKYVSYVQGKLNCTGDGEESQKRIDNFEVDHDCPCPRSKSGYDGKDICKPSGSLLCIIDEAGLFGQAHKFRTTSMNTITGIIGGIELIKAATGGRIAGLPLMLTMNAKNTITPGGIPTTVYIVSICFRGDMGALRQEVLQLINTDKQYLIDMDEVEEKARDEIIDNQIDTEEDEKEFVEEFFPDAIDVNSEPVKTVEKVEKTEQDDKQEDKTEDAGSENDTDDSSDKSLSESIEDKLAKFQGAMEPADEYRALYDRFVNENDFVKAVALAKRLQRGNLLYWIALNHPEVDIAEKIKKSELLLDVEAILKLKLAESDAGKEPEEEKENENDLNENQTQEELDSRTDQDSEGASVEQSGDREKARAWDDGPKIITDQKRRLVGLKHDLEIAGILKPEKWVTHVNFFLDKDGKEVDKAVNLTQKQGDYFIVALTKHLPKK